MAYNTYLERQRARFLMDVGDTDANRALTHLQLLSAWLTLQGYTAKTLPAQLLKYSVGANVPMTKAQTVAGLAGALGPELVVNGSFSDLTGWTTSATAPATATIAGGILTLVSPAGEAAFARQDILVPGRSYQLEIDVTIRSGSLRVLMGDTATGAGQVIISSTGHTSIATVATGINARMFLTRAAACDLDIDNVSVREIFTP